MSSENLPEGVHLTMRLQRFLARAGVASRRGSEKLITAGRVSVNGQIKDVLGTTVCPDLDTILVDGVEVKLKDEHCYLVLHKPSGYITTMDDPQGRPTVASLVPKDIYPGLFPVGRLDCDTFGLLFFTTDGDMAHALMHPKHHVKKHYVALVKGVPTQEELKKLEAGIMLDDGPAQPADDIKVYKDADRVSMGFPKKYRNKTTSLVGISIREGRKHQVKRMFSAIGHDVILLKRDMFGPLELGNLASGSYRLASDTEVAKLRALKDQILN